MAIRRVYLKIISIILALSLIIPLFRANVSANGYYNTEIDFLTNQQTQSNVKINDESTLTPAEGSGNHCLTFYSSSPFTMHRGEHLTGQRLLQYLPGNPLNDSNWLEVSTSSGTVSFDAAEYNGLYYVSLRGKNDALNNSISSPKGAIYATGLDIYCTGDIGYLLDYENNITTVPDYGFKGLFVGFDNLKTPPTLSAKQVGWHSYTGLFSGCTSLEVAPDLPATTITNCSYLYMFRNCISLKEPPKVSALAIEEKCFSYMFENCTSLLYPFDFVYTSSLGKYLFTFMYRGCTSLKIFTEPTKVDGIKYDRPWVMPDSYVYGTPDENCEEMFTDCQVPDVLVAKQTYYIYNGPALPDIEVNVTNPEITYDGTSHQINALEVTKPLEGYTISYSTNKGGTWSNEIPSFTNAKEYKVDFKIEAEGYDTYNGSYTFTINKANMRVTAKDESFIYNGDARTFNVAVEEPTSNYTVYYSNDNEKFTTVIPEFRDVGKYTTYYKVVANNYNDAVGSFNVTVLGQIEDNTQDEIINYDGREHSAKIDIIYPSTGYTIEYSTDGDNYSTTKPKYKNLGEHITYYRVYADNYITLESTCKLTIIKGLIQYTASPYFGEYDGKLHTGMITVSKPTSDFLVTYATTQTGDYTSDIPKYSNAGNYQVFYKITAENYNDVEGSFSVDISKANMQIVAQDTDYIYDGKSKKAAVKVNVPTTGYTIFFAANEGDYTETAPEFTEIGEYNIQYKVIADNYNDAEGSFKLTISKKQTVIIYKLLNKYTGELLFTKSMNEYNKLLKIGWQGKGKAYDSYKLKYEGIEPVYRVFNPLAKGGDHYYTKSQSEAKALVNKGWKWDFKGKPLAYMNGSFDVHRLYHKPTGRHCYTFETSDISKYVKAGWRYEGVAWRVPGYYAQDGSHYQEKGFN